jgi:hypothetical protein
MTDFVKEGVVFFDSVTEFLNIILARFGFRGLKSYFLISSALVGNSIPFLNPGA